MRGATPAAATPAQWARGFPSQWVKTRRKDMRSNADTCAWRHSPCLDASRVRGREQEGGQAGLKLKGVVGQMGLCYGVRERLKQYVYCFENSV